MRTRTGAVGPQVGEPMPDFALPDEHGAIVTLSSLLKAGPAVIDETPMAYKPIDQVMAAQRDLVDIVHELRQVVCVKG